MAGAKKIKGAGDVIKSITEAVGIKPCVNCDQRGDILNVKFPFNKVIALTDDQRTVLKDASAQDEINILNTCLGLSIEYFEGYEGSGVQTAVQKKLEKLLQL